MTKKKEKMQYEDCGECPYGKEDYDGQVYFPLHLATPCISCMNNKVLKWQNKQSIETGK